MEYNLKKIIREEIELSGEEIPKTDPESGYVSPSKKVYIDVCQKEKFCEKQGPITFGQLKKIVETAQKKNLFYDIGEGVYKATIRLIPWFFPQIAIAGALGSSVRAFNKIIKPGLENTTGYKSWWGKTIMKVMDTAEGNIPTKKDPLSKIFFISDGLLFMLDKKYKRKFARYISEVAASKPDSEPVPEYFVENELRSWINQKFILNPPLPPKTMNESEDLDWIRNIDISDYLEPPYFKNMKIKGLPPDEYNSILSKIFNQPVTVMGDSIYGNKGKLIYSEVANGYWEKWEYDANGNQTYFEDELGFWEKWEYDEQRNITYTEDSNGYWSKYGYDELGNEIYYENSDGDMVDNRHLNESDDFDWVRDFINHGAVRDVDLVVGKQYMAQPNNEQFFNDNPEEDEPVYWMELYSNRPLEILENGPNDDAIKFKWLDEMYDNIEYKYKGSNFFKWLEFYEI